MAVYERTYQRYAGAHTPAWSRFFILPRYVFKDVFASRWMVIFFALCFVFPIFCAAFIYLSNNADFLALVPNFELPDFLQVNGEFFYRFLRVQSFFAFALAVFVGPGLVARDLANNGLPLYLSRPFSRTEYVIGKLSVIAILLSSITWVTAFLLALLHANFVGLSWIFQNIGLMLGIFVGAWMWILALGLMALSVSAWVKWRPVAGFAMLAVLFGGAFFGSVMINNLFGTQYGHLLNLTYLINRLWQGLLGVEITGSIPMGAVWFAFLAFLSACVFLLNRKIRAYEVVG